MALKFDLSCEEQCIRVRELLSRFNSKQEVFEYYRVSGNGSNCRILNDTLECLGMGRDYYAKKKRVARVCLQCGKELKRGQIKFCSRSCSCTYNNTRREYSEDRGKHISDGLCRYHESKDGIPYHGLSLRNAYKRRICPVCGNDRMKEPCTEPTICHKNRVFFTRNLMCFGFGESKLGTSGVVDEYKRIGDLLKYEYEHNRLSVGEIKDKYQYPHSVEGLTCIMRTMGVTFRSRQEHTLVSLLHKRLVYSNVTAQFKHGVYVNKKGTRIGYRSSYELAYCEYLDANNVNYEYESLRIPYFDTEKGIYRIAIPDFLLTDTNTIVEVKSLFTFDKQNMVDKFYEYERLGYTPILRLDGSEYSFTEMLELKEAKCTLRT